VTYDARFSELMCFRKCRRSWMHRYYLKLDKPGGREYPPSSSGALEIGTVVDLAFREFYFSGTDMIDAVRRIRDEHVAEVNAPNDGTWEWDKKVYSFALRMVEGYMEWLDETGADAGEITVGVELELSAHIPDTDVNLHVHIDRLIYDTTWDEWIIDDTKTVDTLAKAETFEIDDQLLTYAWVVREALGIDVRRLRHTMLRRVKRTGTAKPPFYGREAIEVNPDRLERHVQHLQGLANDLMFAVLSLNVSEDEHHRVAYPSPSRDCSWWCPAYSICVAHDDGSDINGLRDTLYIRRKDAA
jgi:hypothetical protein